MPDGDVASTPSEAEAIARRLGGTVVVKAQVHAGGRGKAGGVKLAKTPGEAMTAAEQILGMKIKGLTVQKVLVVPAADIASEAYVGIIVDRASKQPVFMVSAAGGIDIEEVAAKTPEKILKHRRSTRATGCCRTRRSRSASSSIATSTQARAAARDHAAALRARSWPTAARWPRSIRWSTTPAGRGRRARRQDGRSTTTSSTAARTSPRCATSAPRSRARWRRGDANLTFIKLDGNVGCVVNGAGLAMATMDLVKYYGGEPANFLDIGGSSNPEKVVNALRIITADPNVKAILFNIFGGITRTDDVANGIVTATKQFQLKVPIVIRLTGTNEEMAMKILQEHGHARRSTDMDEAVQQAVEAREGRTAA